MKKFTKLFLSCTAVAALAAAMGTAAMAAPIATYADGTLTLSGVEATGDQQTIVVLTEDATTVTEELVLAVDQQGETFTTVKLDANQIDAENNTYYVRIGGTDGSIQKTTFGKAASTRLLGDVDNNGTIETADASQIALKTVGRTSSKADFTVKETQLSADTDDNGYIETADALQVALFSVNRPTKVIDGQKTISDKVNQEIKEAE